MTTHGLRPQKALLEGALETIAAEMAPEERAKIQPPVIDRDDFLAAGRRDPEVHAAYMALIRGEQHRYDDWLSRQRQWEGVGDTILSAFERVPNAELLKRAEQHIAEERAFRASPHGMVLAACHEIEAVRSEQSVAGLIAEIRAACSRDFDGSAQYITARLGRLASIGISAQNALQAVAAAKANQENPHE